MTQTSCAKQFRKDQSGTIQNIPRVTTNKVIQFVFQ